MPTLEVELVDLYKIADALKECCEFLRLRDEMNARVHLAATVRYSPLTTTAENARERLLQVLNAQETATESL